MNKARKKTSAQEKRDFDVVLYGASSFVGKYAAEYLLKRTAAEPCRWAIAGRDMKKLEALKQSLGAPDIPCLIADADDEQSLTALAKSTTVIASTVGPYALYGTALISACAKNGTSYCDLTAEIPWVRNMIDTYQEDAKRTGARLVHSCGFDSIPSDLGCWFLQQQAMAQFGESCPQVSFRLKKARGGFSGGTIASLSGMVKAGAENSDTRKLLLNPQALAEPHHPSAQKDRFWPAFDVNAGEWSAPFIMAPFNTRVVQRSHFLAGEPWGRDFAYDEAMLTGKGVLGVAMAAGVTGALGSLVGLTAFRKTRPLMEKILPAPGQGPSRKSVENGFFEIHGYGKTRSGRKIRVIIKGNRDPGYGATSRMLVESALALADKNNPLPVGGGFWTPSVAMGASLLDRLQQHAGMQFTVAAN